MTLAAPSAASATDPSLSRAEGLRGHAAMLLFALAISGSFTLGGLATRHIDPIALTAGRFVVAGCVMGVLAWPYLRVAHLRFVWCFLVLGALLGFYFVMMFEALRLTDPVSTGAVFTLTPIMSAFFGWILLRQVISPLAAGALALGGAGALWVIFRSDIDALMAFDIGPGEKIFLAGCAAHALYPSLVRKWNRGVPVRVFTFGTIVAGAVVVGIAGAPEIAATDWAALPAIVWITLIYLSFCATAMTFFLLQYASMRLPSGKVMAYGYLTPSFVVIWEGLLGHGWVPGLTWLGVAATLGALLILLKA